MDWLTQGPELAEASTKQGPEACVVSDVVMLFVFMSVECVYVMVQAAVGTEPMADRSSTTAPYSYSLQSVMSNITGFLSGGGEDGGKDEEDGEDEWSSRGVSSRGAGTAEWPSASSANAEEPYAAFLQHTRTHAPPVQQCTGCVLHLFISQKQVTNVICCQFVICTEICCVPAVPVVCLFLIMCYRCTVVAMVWVGLAAWVACKCV